MIRRIAIVVILALVAAAGYNTFAGDFSLAIVLALAAAGLLIVGSAVDLIGGKMLLKGSEDLGINFSKVVLYIKFVGSLPISLTGFRLFMEGGHIVDVYCDSEERIEGIQSTLLEHVGPPANIFQYDLQRRSSYE